jgi:DNA-binding HxlR family transcriptional regulator
MKVEDCSPSETRTHSCGTMLMAIADTQYAIGGKWRLQIIIALFDKPKRFNEMQRLIEGISARVLSNELKELELNGFIHRKVDAKATPVVVEYALAEYSKTLETVIQAMIGWGINHRNMIRLNKI